MLSCGSQRVEASSPFKQRLPGITAWWLANRYCVILIRQACTLRDNAAGYTSGEVSGFIPHDVFQIR